MRATLLGLLMLLPLAAAPAEITRMTTDTLAARLDDPGIAILDVRSRDSWRFAAKKIRNAVHVDTLGIPDLANRYAKDTTLVLYCS